MLTPSEYLKESFPENNTLWLSGMDIIRHCLQKDVKQTFFNDNSPHTNYWDAFSEAMQDRAQAEDNFQEIYDNTYQPKQKPLIIQDDSGILDVSAFIAKEELCFESEINFIDNTDAVSVIMDMFIPFRDSEETYMVTRHQKVYDLIAQCDAENRPIQVVGALSLEIPELSEPFKCFIIIKDYSDPIFPTLWGVLKNNKTANNFLNVIMDFFIGTRDEGNGTLKEINNAEQYFADHENLIIFGEKIAANGATYIKD